MVTASTPKTPLQCTHPGNLKDARAQVRKDLDTVLCMGLTPLITKPIETTWKNLELWLIDQKASWINTLTLKQCFGLSSELQELQKKNPKEAAIKGLNLLQTTLGKNPKQLFKSEYAEFKRLLDDLVTGLGLSATVKKAKIVETLLNHSGKKDGKSKGKFNKLLNTKATLEAFGNILRLIVKVNPEAAQQLEV